MTAVAHTILEPLLPWSLTAALLALAAAAIVVAVVRRAPGWPARGLVALVLAATLLGPVLVREQRLPTTDVVVVIDDASPSQAIGQRRARSERAVARLRERLAGFAGLETRVVTTSGTGIAGGGVGAASVSPGGEGAALTPTGGEGGAPGATARRENESAGGASGPFGATDGAPGGSTRLFAALEGALADVPRQRRAGVILVTDGQVHDVPGDAKAAAGALGPVHVLLSGEHTEADRRLRVLEAPGYGLVGRSVTVTVQVDDTPVAESRAGASAGRAGLSLTAEDGQVSRLPVAVGVPVTVPLRLAHAGPNLLELAVEPMAPAGAGASELSLANNRTAIVVNAVRDRLRVLLISGEPYPGERTWRNLLKADPGVELVHFTILRSPEKQDATPISDLALIAFPVRELFEDRLRDFDLIIFDRYRMRSVLPASYLANIAAYVRGGGALLIATGPEFVGPGSLYDTPLASVLPAAPTGRMLERGFRPGLSPLGLRHPVTGGLPGVGNLGSSAGNGPATGAGPAWGRWFRQVEVLAPRGTTVLTGIEDRPLLVLDRVESGRVALLTSDQIWLWSRGFEGGGPHGELLRRLAHWLMKEPALEETTLSAQVESGSLVIERRSLEPAPATVAVTRPSGTTATVGLHEDRPGVARGRIPAPESGVYRIDDGRRSAVAVVGGADEPEQVDLRTTPERLAPLVAAAGGGMWWLETLEQQGAGLPGLLHRSSGPPYAGSGWLSLKANEDYRVVGTTHSPLLPPWAGLVLALAALLIAWYREGR